jgi:hypothetical protein
VGRLENGKKNEWEKGKWGNSTVGKEGKGIIGEWVNMKMEK